MKELKLYQGGHPFKNDDLNHMSDGLKEAFKAFAQGIDTNKNFILDGAVITTAGPNTLITDGYISLEGEIYEIKAQSISTISGTLHFYVKQYALPPDVPTLNVEEPSPSQLVNPNYGQLYQDGFRKDVHIVKRVEIKFNAIAGDSATGIIYVAGSIPKIKQVRDALNRAAYKNEENLYTATQSFGEGTLDTVDVTIGSETHKQLRIKNNGNTFIYNPGADVIVSRVNLVDNTNPGVSSPNITNDDGTEITIHVISGSVRLINYSAHIAGAYATSGGILIPPSVGGTEIYIPAGSTISLIKTNNYGSQYEYFLKSVNSPRTWVTTDSSGLGASPGILYTKIAELTFSAPNQSFETILDISNDSTPPNGTLKTFNYTKISIKAETESNFATSASCEVKWIGGVGIYNSDIFARLEVKTTGQQIIRIYLRYSTAYSKFKISKNNIDGVKVLSLQPLLSTLPTPIGSPYLCTQAFLRPIKQAVVYSFVTSGTPVYTDSHYTFGANLKKLITLPNNNGRRVAISFTIEMKSNWPNDGNTDTDSAKHWFPYAAMSGSPFNSGQNSVLDQLSIDFRFHPAIQCGYTQNGSGQSPTILDAGAALWRRNGIGAFAIATKAFITPFCDPGTDISIAMFVTPLSTDRDAIGPGSTVEINNIQYFFEDEYTIS